MGGGRIQDSPSLAKLNEEPEAWCPGLRDVRQQALFNPYLQFSSQKLCPAPPVLDLRTGCPAPRPSHCRGQRLSTENPTT